MRLTTVKVIEGLFTKEQKVALVERITEAIIEVEGERMRPLTWVGIEEVKSGDWASEVSQSSSRPEHDSPWLAKRFQWDGDVAPPLDRATQQFKESSMATERRRIEKTTIQQLGPDELKDSVRNTLLSMTELERNLFIKRLEYEMFRSGLSIRLYLVPLGIAGRCVEDLTPGEVGHLIRFFRINVPKAMSAVERALAGCPVLASGRELAAA